MWTLQYFGDDTVEKPFNTVGAIAGWGINFDTSFDCGGLAGDTVDLQTNDAFDSAFQFAYEKRIVIWRGRTAVGAGGTKWFDGFVTTPERANDRGTQHHNFRLMNWVWFAKQETFRQFWISFDHFTMPLDLLNPANVAVYGTAVNSEVILGEAADGTYQSNGAQMMECLSMLNRLKNPTWQSSAASPVDPAQNIVQYGDASTFPTQNILKVPARDQKIVEILRDMQRSSPLSVFQTDYTTTPPTVSCRAPSVGFTVNYSTKNITQLRLKPRPDLVRSGVVIKYKKSVTVNLAGGGTQGVTQITFDKYPADVNELRDKLEFMSYSLTGFNVTNSSTTLKTLPVNATHADKDTRLAWWIRQCPKFKDSPRIALGTLDVDPATVVAIDEETGLTVSGLGSWFEFLAGYGSIMPWQNATLKKVTITGHASYQQKNTATGLVNKVVPDEEIHARISICNIDTGSAVQTFNHTDVSGIDEIVPIGVAQGYYNDLSILQQEGTCGLVGVDVDGDAAVGKLATIITPGGTYAAMPVQGVRGTIARGVTSFTLGPPTFLGWQDRIEFAKITRSRSAMGYYSERTGPV
jgi:hypothetical protein